MIFYLLKSGFCLFVALGFYKCWLENEKMHRFNRLFLLSSLSVSLLAPLLSVNVQPEIVPLANAMPVQFVERSLENAFSQTGQSRANDSATGLWSYGYWLVATVLLARFGRNLHALFHKISRHPTSPFGSATLVLLPENGLPYTFLHYLFVDRTAYENQTIEDELYAHELAHIRQWHSVDILLIELLTCFLWANPVLLWYKRAIQLNHEFLADDAVTSHCPSVAHYQHLLLDKIALSLPVFLTSNLTFQTTKQRFRMMTKQTSRARLLTLAIGAILLLTGLTVAVSTQTIAQVAPGPAKPNAVSQNPETDVAGMERLYNTKMVYLPGQPGDRKPIQKRYSDLSADEKENVIFIKPHAPKTPTEAEFSAWKNPKKYGMWVDDKRVRNFANTTLKASDIASYSGSFVHKNARQPEGYLYQMDLMTHKNYAAYLKEKEKLPFLILIKDRPKAR